MSAQVEIWLRWAIKNYRPDYGLAQLPLPIGAWGFSDPRWVLLVGGRGLSSAARQALD